MARLSVIPASMILILAGCGSDPSAGDGGNSATFQVTGPEDPSTDVGSLAENALAETSAAVERDSKAGSAKD